MYKSPFLQSVHDLMLAKHYRKRAISTYITWIKGFIHFSGKRHPRQMGEAEVIRFLNHLAVNHSVSPSTTNTALNAIAFLYNKFVKKKIPSQRATRPQATELTPNAIGLRPNGIF